MLRGVLVRVLLLPLTALACVLVLLGTSLSSLVPALRDSALVVARYWGLTMLALSGARVAYAGLEHVDRDAPQIYVSNHQSNIDVWALLAIVPPTTRFAAKAELFRMPLLGWTLRTAGFVPVDRRNRTAAIDSLARAAVAIRSGRSMLLYPEGTRTRDGRLQPFKKGAFHLALAADVPLVPTAVSGAYDVMPTGTWRITPGPVTVRFCAPIDVGPYRPAGHARLLADVRATIAADLDAGPHGQPASAPATAARNA